MRELIVTGDPVLLSVLRFHLEDAGLQYDVFGTYTNSLFPGDLNFATSRVMVSDDDFYQAHLILNSLGSFNDEQENDAQDD